MRLAGLEPVGYYLHKQVKHSSLLSNLRLLFIAYSVLTLSPPHFEVGPHTSSDSESENFCCWVRISAGWMLLDECCCWLMLIVRFNLPSHSPLRLLDGAHFYSCKVLMCYVDDHAFSYLLVCPPPEAALGLATSMCLRML